MNPILTKSSNWRRWWKFNNYYTNDDDENEDEIAEATEQLSQLSIFGKLFIHRDLPLSTEQQEQQENVSINFRRPILKQSNQKSGFMRSTNFWFHLLIVHHHLLNLQDETLEMQLV